MSKTSIKALGYFLTFSVSLSAFAAKGLNTDKKKVSYAVGQQIAKSFKSQNFEIDVDVLSQSIKDGISGKNIKMTAEEMSHAMQKLQLEMSTKEKAKSEKNKVAGTAYLEANKKKDGVKVTASGLQYKVLKEGKGDSPKKEDSVLANYKGALIDGTEFDSSYKRGAPSEFPVQGVISGWTEALLTMKPGEKRELYIPSNLAYGDQGRPGIPPASVLVFEIELVSVNKAKK